MDLKVEAILFGLVRLEIPDAKILRSLLVQKLSVYHTYEQYLANIHFRVAPLDSSSYLQPFSLKLQLVNRRKLDIQQKCLLCHHHKFEEIRKYKRHNMNFIAHTCKLSYDIFR